MTLAALFFPILFAAPTPAPIPVPMKNPVAVIPFKNLGGDPGLDWLGNGIAETMISDLRKAKTYTLVERAQVQVALAEILNHTQTGAEDAAAVRVGRMVGAKSIVVGGYQQAGKALRINARFVDVETGVILDSVKATGAMDNVFAVQDQVVDKLLGLTPKAVAAKPPRKTAPKQVEAYRLYAISLVTLSDAQQSSYLKQALEVDPTFVYADEALSRLEERLAAYETRAGKALDERHRSMRTKLHDPATPEADRALLAMSLMNELIQRRRFALAAEEAKKVYEMKFPPAVNMDPHEWSSYNLVLTHKFLKREDLALQYAERHLQEFPAGPSYTGVDMMAKEIVQRRKQSEQDLQKREAEHAETDNDIAKLLADNPKVSIERIAGEEVAKCVFDRYNILPRETEEDCRLFIEKYRGSNPPIPPMLLMRARYHRALALYELGRFKEAKDEIDAIEKDAPAFATDVNMRMATSFWALD